jgi:endoglucanase
MTRTTARAGVLAAVAALGLVACGNSPESSSSSAPSAAGTGSSDAAELWLNPEGHGPAAVRAAEAQGKTEEAAALAPLAEQPTATWFADPADPFVQAERLSMTAEEAGELPVFVAYNVPGRDCGLYSSGGATDIDAYLSWIGSLAAGLGDRPALVVLEPDAIAQVVEDGCDGVDPAARFEALAQAVQILDRQPTTRVYLDAGNSGWVTEPHAIADALSRSGIADTEGFAVNVSNFQTTEDSVAYGTTLIEHFEDAGVPDLGFVIDTSRNGAGPPPDDGVDHWCNPPGRRLGEAPTTSPGLPGVDALLWVKQPGDSDGPCRGAPAAGQWWPSAALELAGG